MKIEFGKVQQSSKVVECQPDDLLRHLFIAGSTGSGKTVLGKRIVEQLSQSESFCLVIDPQGDWGSMLLGKDLDCHNFWPLGLNTENPISLMPSLEVEGLNNEERDLAIYLHAAALTELCGHDIRQRKSKRLIAATTLIFEDLICRNDISLESFYHSLSWSNDEVDKVISRSERKNFLFDIQGKMVGLSGRLLLEGEPISFCLRKAISIPSIAILDISRLISPEMKNFVVAVVINEIFRLRQLQEGIRSFVAIDEMSLFAPPIKKTASKEAITNLLKQGRKYGLGCILLSQSPGDIDYRVVGQANSFAIGSLTQKREHDKIIETFGRSFNVYENVRSTLSRLKVAEFITKIPLETKAIQVKAPNISSVHRLLSDEEAILLANKETQSKLIVINQSEETLSLKEYTKTEYLHPQFLESDIRLIVLSDLSNFANLSVLSISLCFLPLWRIILYGHNKHSCFLAPNGYLLNVHKTLCLFNPRFELGKPLSSALRINDVFSEKELLKMGWSKKKPDLFVSQEWSFTEIDERSALNRFKSLFHATPVEAIQCNFPYFLVYYGGSSTLKVPKYIERYDALLGKRIIIDKEKNPKSLFSNC